ncbi:hypothetical protein FQN57_006086 [Myotisia sp. PD_48]|nr:hypothetical protein FQN57_006086 [Myotisia sp. PD_48]
MAIDVAGPPSSQEAEILALSKGLVSLLEAAQRLSRQEQILQDRLQFAYEEYEKLAIKLPGNSSENIRLGCRALVDAPVNDRPAIDSIEWIRKAEKAGYLSSSAATLVSEGFKISESALHKADARNDQLPLKGCPVLGHSTRRGSMEHDFTTVGTKGNLRCPFSKDEPLPASTNTLLGVGETCAIDHLDPINAERNRDRATSTTRSVQSSGPLCPIRFLENHSPEELAEYFQKHKHEIPRSHSLCIRRYQNDPQSSRKLDAKYGNVINMVQGLGAYHKPYLSTPLEIEETAELLPSGSHSAERVEKWAEDVSINPTPEGPSPDGDQTYVEPGVERERESHFERSLRDVRVGESPSRPWGIHVPLSQEPVESADAFLTIPRADAEGNISHYDSPPTITKEEVPDVTSNGRLSALGQTSTYEVDTNVAEARLALEDDMDSSEQSKPSFSEELTAPQPPAGTTNPPPPMTSSQPKMVFNGPVFFGYTAEAAALLLESMATQHQAS